MSKASESSRHSGAIGSGPTAVTKYVLENLSPDIGRILDYGSGKVPRQTEILRQHGYTVSAYDMPKNNVVGVHATPREVYIDTNWDMIMLSNVLNVQGSALQAAMLVAAAANRGPRIVIFNLPDDPVYWMEELTAKERRKALMLELAIMRFGHIEIHPYSSGVVYVMDRGIPPRPQPQRGGCMFGGY